MARDNDPGSIHNPDPTTGGNPNSPGALTGQDPPGNVNNTGAGITSSGNSGHPSGGGGTTPSDPSAPAATAVSGVGGQRIVGYDSTKDLFYIMDKTGKVQQLTRAQALTDPEIGPSELDEAQARAESATKTLTTYGQSRAIGYDGRGGVLIQGGNGAISTVTEADAIAGKYPGVSAFDVNQVKGEYQRYQNIINSSGNYQVAGTDGKGNVTLQKGDGTFVTVPRAEATSGKYPGITPSEVNQAFAKETQLANYQVIGSDAAGNVTLRKGDGTTVTVNKAAALNGQYPGIAASDVQQALIKQNEANFQSSAVPDYAGGQGVDYQGLDTTVGPPPPVPGTAPAARAGGGTPPGAPAPTPLPQSGAHTGTGPPPAAPPNPAPPPGAPGEGTGGPAPTPTAPGAGGGTWGAVQPGAEAVARMDWQQPAQASGNPWAPNIPANQPPAQRQGGAPDGGTGDGGTSADLAHPTSAPATDQGSSAGQQPAGGGRTMSSQGGAADAGGTTPSVPGFGAPRPTYGRGQTFAGQTYTGSQQNLSLSNQGMQNYYQHGQLQFQIANQGRQQAYDSNRLATELGTATREGQSRSFEGMGPMKGSTIVGQ